MGAADAEGSAAKGSSKEQKSSKSSHHKERRGESRRTEKSSSDKAISAAFAPAPAKDKGDKPSSSEKVSSAAPSKESGKKEIVVDGAAATSSRRPEARKSSEKDRDAERPKEKEKEKEKSRSGTGAGEVQRIGGYTRHVVPVRTTRDEGLTEEVLTQIAQAKFEAQEDRLKDVARFSVALLRDFPKLSPADRAKRILEVQKSLLKYDMQFIRSWEYQEKRRRSEVAGLEVEAERCRSEAEAEATTILELRAVLANEKRRRERYELYEERAAEVNRKRTRDEYAAAIVETKEGMSELKRRRSVHDALVEERMQRAQLLAHAVAELKEDLKIERDNLREILKGTGAEASAGSASAGATLAAAAAAAAAAAPGRGGFVAGRAGELVEVIS